MLGAVRPAPLEAPSSHIPARLSRLAPAAIGAILATAVCLPWIGQGWLLALDWVNGPQVKPPAQWGLTAEGQPSIAMDAVVRLCSWLIGGAMVSWLTVWVALFLAVVFAARATPGGPVAKCISGSFYCVNPFVFERVYAGQIFVLMGYAVLPLVATSLVRSFKEQGRRRLSAAVWITLDGAISIHFVWIGMVLLAAFAIWHRTKRALVWSLTTVATCVLLNAYLFLPELLQRAPIAVGSSDLTAFRTASDRTYGLYVNVLGLYGFWRRGPILPKTVVVAWPLLLAVILGLAVIGWWRHAPILRDPLLGTLGIAAVLAFFLSLGSQGPTGPLFQFLYDHLPGFAVMREPEKFSAVLALAYAISLGLGVETVAGRIRNWRPSATSAIAGLGILAYTPTLFWGLSGQLTSAAYPSDWTAANRIMGHGPGSILSLPLNQYLSFAFTGRRVIANPAPSVFTRRVLVGGQVDAGPLATDSVSPMDAFLKDVVTHGSRITHLGHLLSQLGVRYIVLFKTADYQSYKWLRHQTDLVRLFDTPDIVIYRNPSALAQGARLTSSLDLPSIDCFYQLEQKYNLDGYAIYLQRDSICPTTIPNLTPAKDVRYDPPFHYRVASGPAGVVIIPRPGDQLWSSPQAASQPLIDGVQGFISPTKVFTITYFHWWSAPIGDLVSLAIAGGICLRILDKWKPAPRASATSVKRP